MKRIGLILLAAVSLLGILKIPVAIAQTTPPTITFASADTTKKILTVKGNNFGSIPKVFLGTSLGKLSSLSILSKTTTSITTRLTTVTPGSYLLVVANGTLRGSASITLGAVGPQGPPGIVGYPCWDDNGSGVCELDTEDLNKDGVCNVSDCRMPIVLSGARYDHRNLAGSDFSHVILSGADFRDSNLIAVNFSYANLRGAIFGNGIGYVNDTNLSGAYFLNSDCTAADFAQGDLRAADFSNANLSAADLRSTNLAGANFSGANVANALWSGATCPNGITASGSPASCAGKGGGL